MTITAVPFVWTPFFGQNPGIWSCGEPQEIESNLQLCKGMNRKTPLEGGPLPVAMKWQLWGPYTYLGNG